MEPKPTKPNVYIFEQDQLVRLLDGAIDMFVEFRDHHGKPEDQAKPCAVLEMIDGLNSERELAADDPMFHITSQIYPITPEAPK